MQPVQKYPGLANALLLLQGFSQRWRHWHNDHTVAQQLQGISCRRVPANRTLLGVSVVYQTCFLCKPITNVFSAGVELTCSLQPRGLSCGG